MHVSRPAWKRIHVCTQNWLSLSLRPLSLSSSPLSYKKAHHSTSFRTCSILCFFMNLIPPNVSKSVLQTHAFGHSAKRTHMEHSTWVSREPLRTHSTAPSTGTAREGRSLSQSRLVKLCHQPGSHRSRSNSRTVTLASGRCVQTYYARLCVCCACVCVCVCKSQY
jgi:hypothetical protein